MWGRPTVLLWCARLRALMVFGARLLVSWGCGAPVADRLRGGRLTVCLCLFCSFMRCLLMSVRVRFVDGFVGVSDARLFHSRSVAYKCYWLARDVFGYGEEPARARVYGGLVL